MGFLTDFLGTVIIWANCFDHGEDVPDCQGQSGVPVCRPIDMFTEHEVLYSGLDVRMVGARKILDGRIETQKLIDNFLHDLLERNL